jgi:hypothetical protein
LPSLIGDRPHKKQQSRNESDSEAQHGTYVSLCELAERFNIVRQIRASLTRSLTARRGNINMMDDRRFSAVRSGALTRAAGRCREGAATAVRAYFAQSIGRDG